MNRILLFCSLGLMLGCRQAATPSGEVITLSYATSSESKTDALAAGDEVAVFARLEGTEHYFLEGVKFVTGSDGQSLSASPMVHYPGVKQAVEFFAYFPYHTGAFSVPSDQSTPTALKQADLCWATAQSTPVSVVPLEFRHLFSRLVVTTNEPTAKVACSVVPSGVLNAATAQFTLNHTKSEVSTTGNELILPAQPLNRLILTVSGVDYLFDTPLTLEAGKTTSLHLTLNSSTHTATLNGSSTTDWTSSTQQGNLSQAVSNILTLHWANYVPQGATPDKIVLTINGSDYTVSNGITYTNKTFTVPFASDKLRYPYTISKITFSGIPLACNQLLGEVVYKSGSSTIGIKDIPNAVLINGVWWATGNLVATGTRGAAGLGGCKIGAPGDGGVYFQFGSLIGWKGGNQNNPINAGNGVGIPQAPLTTNGRYWNDSGYSWALDAMVWPSELAGTKTSWTNTTGSSISTLSDYYFNYSVAPWEETEKDIRAFNVSISGDSGSGTLASGRYASKGVGDPCTYYLGGTWRLPTSAEIVALCNNQRPGYEIKIAWGSCGASWVSSGVTGGNFASNKLFFPASGYRNYSNGSFHNVTANGYYWSSSVYAAARGLDLYFYSSWASPQDHCDRSLGFPVRCVSSVP